MSPSLLTPFPAFPWGKVKAEKDGWPPHFVKNDFVFLPCLTNGAPVEGCMSRSASEGMAGQVATCGVSVESAGHACRCWRVRLKPTCLSLAVWPWSNHRLPEFQGSHHVYNRSD